MTDSAVGPESEPAPTSEPDLDDGELALLGRIESASNATFLGSIGSTRVVYKPSVGEKPLWDFPDGDLAERERAAYLVSESLGWNIVPRTWLRDGPFGVGMVQLWQDIDPEQDPIDLVPSAPVDAGWRHVLDAEDEEDRRVMLIHEDSPELRRMAVFDVLVNNADRKGGHILPLADGHRHGVDHGLTFHVEHKLRTVLWGWLGDELDESELAGIDRVRADLEAELGTALAELLTPEEVEALAHRCERLRFVGRFPPPRGRMPAVPWPIF